MFSTARVACARDLRVAVRRLRSTPGFTLVATLTLALAIGANTAIFSVVDAVLLDPLSFREPDQLIVIRGTAPESDLGDEFNLGAEFYLTYKDGAATLADLSFAGLAQTTVRSGEHVERLFISPSPPSLFSTLGVSTVVGRLPTDEDTEGSVVVISHSLWTNWFGRDAALIGRSIEVSGELRTIIGVMEPAFRYPDERVAVWTHDLITPPVRPGGFNLSLLGRMAPGADHSSVLSELRQLTPRVIERFGGTAAYARILESYSPLVRSLQHELVGDHEKPLWILMATVAIVLLIACANVANLLLVRAQAREADLAVRRALGAGRGGLVLAQMAEPALLAVIGGVAGVVVAWIGVPVVVSVAPESIPRLGSVGIDGGALLFTTGAAIFAALAAGLLPAQRASKRAVIHGLGEAHRVRTAGSLLPRNGLVVFQTALAFVLLVGSGLLLQSFRTLRSVDPGYEIEDIFTFQMAPNQEEHGLIDGPSFARFHHRFMDRLAVLPDIESVGLVATLPLDEGAGQARVATEGWDGPVESAPLVHVTFAGGDYFQSMGIRLLSGDYFERRESPTNDVNAIVSRSAAEYLWPGENPLGQVIRPAAGGDAFPWITVGGVVEDILLTDLQQPEPDKLVYLPMVGPAARAWGVDTPAYVVKTGRADRIAPEIRSLIDEIAPEAPMYRIFTMKSLADRSMARLSFTMLVLIIAAGLALALGTVGIYGMLSAATTERTREIGIRIAMGARGAQVRRMVVRQCGSITLIGVVVGLGTALYLTRFIESLLFGVDALDITVLTAVCALVIAVGLLAGYLPARRASRVDPVLAIRSR